MSEILKYKKALNFRANPRYLRRDFIVPLYTGTEPDIYEDKKPNMNDPGMVVDPSRILPKNFTDDMPFVTDENNTEQLELAGGGRVEFELGGRTYKINKPLTTEQQNRIKKNYPNADFSKFKYGFSEKDTNNYKNVYSFVKRGKTQIENRLEKLKEIVLESNLKSFESLNESQVAIKAGYVSAANLKNRTEVRNIMNQLIPLEEKFSNYLNNVINNLDNIPYEDIVKAGGMNKYVAKPFGVDKIALNRKINNAYSKPEFKEARDIIKLLSNPQVFDTYGKRGMFAGEVLDNLDATKSARRLKGGSIGNEIINTAERSMKAGNKNINFLTKPGTVDASDIVFEWNGKLYGKDIDEYKGRKVNNLTTDLYKLPEFNEYLDVKTKINDLRKKQVIDPQTKKSTTYDQLLRKTYAEGFGKNTSYERSGLELDHLNIKDEPFSNLRPLPAHINQTAGLIKKSMSIIEDKDKALKAIGYFMPEDALENSILKFSDRVLNKKIPVSKTYDVGLRAVTGGSKEYLSPESKITTEGLQKGRTGSESLFKKETQVMTSSGLRDVSPKEKIDKVFNVWKQNILEGLSDEVKDRVIGIASKCPTEYGNGGRVRFKNGSNCYIKGVKNLEEGNLSTVEINKIEKEILEANEMSSLKRRSINVAKDALKIVKGGANLFEAFVSVGPGKIGLGAGVLFEGMFAYPELKRGDYREAIRNLFPSQILQALGLPVGLPFESLQLNESQYEDIIDVAQNAGADVNKVKKFAEYSKNIKKEQDLQQELSLLQKAYKNPNDPDFLEQSKRFLNKLDQIDNYFNNNPFSQKEIEDLTFEFTKAAKYRAEKNMENTILQKKTPETTADAQRALLNQPFENVYGENKEEMFSKIGLPKPLEKEEEPPEELPSEYKVSAAEGGRIGLKEGTKIGKRGFLKAAAALALTPEIIKAIKGAGQTGKIASKIKIEPAEGMYPWFPKLVEKVKEMGKPFEEKQLIMEPSYKNSPRPFTSRPPTGEEKLTKHVDGDTTFILREYPDGRLAVDIDSPRNQQSFGQPVSLYYRPKMEIQNYKGEKKIEPPEFKVLEPEPRPFVTGPDDVDITFTEIPKNPKRDIVFADIEAAERFATGNIKNRKIIPVKQSLRNEMEEDPSTFIMRESGELGSKARPEEIIKKTEDFATGGRVSFGDGSKDPNRLIPIDPLLQDQSPTDPGKRDVLKLGIAGAGILGLGKLGLLKLGSSIKPSVFAEAVKGTTAPSWMDSLMTKILTEGTEIKMPKESGIIKKEVQFKNPETGDVQTATLTIDSKEDRMFIAYDSPTNVANQPVVLELSRERKVVPNPGGESNWFAPDKTKGYNFYATETGPRVVDYDGTIEFDAEDTAFKIIDLKSDISGLKSYATGGKGIDKKIAKQKRAATADIEKNPEDYVPDWEPEIYD